MSCPNRRVVRDLLLRTQRSIVEVEALAHLATPSESERLHRKVRKLRNDADDVALKLLG